MDDWRGIRFLVLLHLARDGIVRHPGKSGVTALVVLLATATIVATSGRTDATRSRLLARLEEPSSRLVRVVDRTGAAGLTAVDVTRLATLASVEWVIGLSAVGPLARNAAIGGPVEGYARDAVGSRWYWGDLLHSNLVRLRAGRSPRPGEAVAGEQASATLGLADAVGTVDDESAGAVAIVGTVAPAAAVGNLSAYILIRGEGSGAQLREILILVRSSGEVEGLVSRLPGLLAVVDSRSLGVQRAEELLAIRETLANEVGSLNAAVLFASLSTSALLIAILLYGVVEGRRREFGLRRTRERHERRSRPSCWSSRCPYRSSVRSSGHSPGRLWCCFRLRRWPIQRLRCRSRD